MLSFFFFLFTRGKSYISLLDSLISVSFSVCSAFLARNSRISRCSSSCSTVETAGGRGNFLNKSRAADYYPGQLSRWPRISPTRSSPRHWTEASLSSTAKDNPSSGRKSVTPPRLANCGRCASARASSKERVEFLLPVFLLEKMPVCLPDRPRRARGSRPTPRCSPRCCQSSQAWSSALLFTND